MDNIGVRTTWFCFVLPPWCSIFFFVTTPHKHTTHSTSTRPSSLLLSFSPSLSPLRFLPFVLSVFYLRVQVLPVVGVHDVLDELAHPMPAAVVRAHLPPAGGAGKPMETLALPRVAVARPLVRALHVPVPFDVVFFVVPCHLAVHEAVAVRARAPRAVGADKSSETRAVVRAPPVPAARVGAVPELGPVRGRRGLEEKKEDERREGEEERKSWCVMNDAAGSSGGSAAASK